ncbi:hypothetical protein BH24ACT3_BH24ACT3_16210 [soil metagenome]
MASPVDPTRHDPVAAPGASAEWPAQAADTIEKVVGSVRDKTTGPILTAARAIVFGLLAAFAGTAAAVLFAVGTVRAIDNYLPDAAFGDNHTWAAHGLVGILFVLVGAFCWSKALRRPRRA